MSIVQSIIDLGGSFNKATIGFVRYSQNYYIPTIGLKESNKNN